AAIPTLTDGGRAIQTGTRDATHGLEEVGPIEVSNGSGCGGFGRKGSYEGAYAMLRNRAAEMGATYVKITQQEAPYADGSCMHNEFTIRGIAYRATATATSGSESPRSEPLPPVAAADACNPPCSPGYACEAGACMAVCNPSCSSGFVC